MDERELREYLRRVKLANLSPELRWRIIAAAKRRMRGRRSDRRSVGRDR